MASNAELKELAFGEGASLFGVADLSTRDIPVVGTDVSLVSYPFAISVAVRLSSAVLDGIGDCPTQLYFHHYRTVNALLDRIALRLVLRIQDKGRQALAIPASQIVDWENQRGHLSHRAVAEAAGLGWMGRNNLLVTPEFGSQVRLVTVLTDAPLSATSLVGGNCGGCCRCASVCPADAIGEDRKSFNHTACFEKMKEFRNKGHVGHYICGICVNACSGGLPKNGVVNV